MSTLRPRAIQPVGRIASGKYGVSLYISAEASSGLHDQASGLYPKHILLARLYKELAEEHTTTIRQGREAHRSQNRHLLLGPYKHPPVLLQRLLHEVVPALRPRADLLHLELHLLPQERFPETRFQPDVVIAFDECHAQRRGDELLHRIATAASNTSTATTTASSAGLRKDVLSLFDLGDVLGHCGVCADTVGVHQGDEFGFGEVSWRSCLAVRDIGFCGLEDLVEDEVRKLLAALPFFVGVYIEVVSLQDD